MEKLKWRARLLILVSASTVFLLAAEKQGPVSSRAYKGHESDKDVLAFVQAYPQTAGTRLDDCQTCHKSGPRGTDAEREYNPCGYCHLLVYPNSRYKTGLPKTMEDTLNPYGLDFKKGGRSVQALRDIAGRDSDGDGSPNAAEISDLRYPGDPASRPGQPQAASVSLSLDSLRTLPLRKQFMLMNTTKEPTDDYVNYSGVRVIDVLTAAGVDLKGAAGITVFAPDGYSVDATVEDVIQPFPQGYFYAEPRSFRDPKQAFVKYPENIPAEIRDGEKIPALPWLILAFQREGSRLDPATYEKGTGRLAGEGPFRLVRPQRELGPDPTKPGRPDRALKAGKFGDGWDFDARIDHNAGYCVRGACVIRVNPMPPGFEEYDWRNGWRLIQDRRLVIYGRGVETKAAR
jgi:hypothetical protein